MCVLKQRLSAKTQVNLVYIQPIYLNLQKSNTTTKHGISARRDEMGKECECEERRIMLTRNQRSRLCVDLDSMEMRTCLVSMTVSVGE